MESIQFNEDGLIWHCRVAALLLQKLPRNPHTKHHVRGAIREASVSIRGKHRRLPEGVEFFSATARDMLARGEISGLVREHVVPVSIINEKVIALVKPTEKDIIEIVRNWTIMAAITQEEHDLLRQKSCMTKCH
ncbi:hypothetical protein [Paenacidovorax monticola]|uniref:Uncharacterized protein n=1 Tax=Paenacidovorax monticola TaxID=1926868 RepID=A0A7H0HGH0_9BURK|nr:hypothetical protein [Paenacidovorax monticola]QNP59636.1 hypothetical protein H9L24_01045 [Paenacidovorax monticola]